MRERERERENSERKRKEDIPKGIPGLSGAFFAVALSPCLKRKRFTNANMENCLVS